MEQTPKEALNDMAGHIRDYLDTGTEIVKLRAIKHTGTATGNIVAVLLLALFLLVAYIMLNISVVFYIHQCGVALMHSFLYIGGANLVLAVLFALLKDSLVVKPVRNLIIRIMTR